MEKKVCRSYIRTDREAFLQTARATGYPSFPCPSFLYTELSKRGNCSCRKGNGRITYSILLFHMDIYRSDQY